MGNLLTDFIPIPINFYIGHLQIRCYSNSFLLFNTLFIIFINFNALQSLLGKTNYMYRFET